MPFQYDDIRWVHVELSSFCNAACPICARNHRGGARKISFTQAQILLSEFVSWFPPEFVSKITEWVFCGSLGDPCTAKDAVEIVSYVREMNPRSRIRLNTNGGMRNPEFWEKLAGGFSKKYQGEVAFSVDGLEDTNHIYRRNVEWAKVMANARAFIGAGGTAVWDYLIFLHNEHQIKEAEALAARMGFAHFIPKKAHGLESGPQPVYSEDGKLEYMISAPRDPENRNKSTACGETPCGTFPARIDTSGFGGVVAKARQEFDPAAYPVHEAEEFRQQEKAPINCKSIRTLDGREAFDLYVNSFGQVFPCCYAGTASVSTSVDYAYLQLDSRLRELGLDRMTLRTTSLKEILSGGYLDRLYTDSWKRESFAQGRLKVCARTCKPDSPIDEIFKHKDDTRVTGMNLLQS